jgi:hypothetical protein
MNLPPSLPMILAPALFMAALSHFSGRPCSWHEQDEFRFFREQFSILYPRPHFDTIQSNGIAVAARNWFTVCAEVLIRSVAEHTPSERIFFWLVCDCQIGYKNM